MAELTDFVQGAGIDSWPALINEQEILDDSIAEFESATGWHPFLVGTSLVESYRLHGYRLDFPVPYYAITQIEQDSRILLIDEDYQTILSNGHIIGIRLSFSSDLSEPLVVTGQKGYGSEIPADAWNGVLYRSAAELIRHVNGSQLSSQITEIKQDSVSIQYSHDTPVVIADWFGSFHEACKNYRIVHWGMG